MNDKRLKIALLQILPTGTLEGNLKKGILYCMKAKEQGADIALFPEMWSDGYEIPEDIEELNRMAVPADGEFVKAFGSLAAELDMAIAITILEKHDPMPRNTVVLFDRHGMRQYIYMQRFIPVTLVMKVDWKQVMSFLLLIWIQELEK